MKYMNHKFYFQSIKSNIHKKFNIKISTLYFLPNFIYKTL